MNAILNWFMEPMMYPFMQRALIIALVSGLACAMLSCFIALKGWSLLGDAISHAVLPGLVLAFMTGLPMAIGAFLAGLLCTFGAGFIHGHSRLKADTSLGIVFSGMFGIGLVLFTIYTPGQHLTQILFGDLLGVTQNDLHQVLIIAVVVIVLILLNYRNLILFSFDAGFARVAGLNVQLMNYGLLLLLALTIVSALQAVGMILVVGMLITPGLTAQVLCRRFFSMMLVAIISVIVAATMGTMISYHANVTTGPSIVLLQSALFMLAYVYSLWRNKSRSVRIREHNIQDDKILTNI